MGEPDHEVLVILEPGRESEAVTALRDAASVSQVGSPRVVLIHAADAEAARTVSGVAGVYTERVPDAVRDELAAGERLFVEAWEQRLVGKPERPGQGLDWDAPGHLPPDRPRGGGSGDQ